MGQNIMDEHIKGSKPSSADKSLRSNHPTTIEIDWTERGRGRGREGEREVERERERELCGEANVCRRTPANMRMGR